MGRRALVTLIALALLIALAVRPATGQEVSDVQAVLDARMTAWQANDRSAWMATVDPQAPQAFKDAQARLFDGLRSMPFSTFRLTARTNDSGDLAPDPARFLPETRMHTRVEAYDERDAVDTLWWTYIERDGRWYVTSDTDLVTLGIETARGLWDAGPVDVVRGERAIVVHHPGDGERARELLGMTEEALGTMAERWDKPWPGKTVVVLPGSVEELELILQSTIDLDKFVAFTSIGILRDEGREYEATSPRVYVQERNLRRYDRAFQTLIMVHELVHAAAAYVRGPAVPSWVDEGVADWIAMGRSTTERRPRGSDGRLPRDHEFSTGSQSAISTAYNESRSAMSYAAARHGPGAPSSILTAAGASKDAPGSLDHRVDGAVRAVTGAGLGDLETGWARR